MKAMLRLTGRVLLVVRVGAEFYVLIGYVTRITISIHHYFVPPIQELLERHVDNEALRERISNISQRRPSITRR